MTSSESANRLYTLLRGERITPGNGDFNTNYQRLAQLKSKKDPHNLFRLNQNIKPAEAW